MDVAIGAGVDMDVGEVWVELEVSIDIHIYLL